MAVVWVTGASSGLGEHLGLELARRGHSIGLVARRADKLEAVRAQIASLGSPVAMAPADVTDLEALREAFSTLEKSLGPVDVLVANAGVSGALPNLAELDVDQVRHTFGVNVFGAVNALQLVLPSMLERNAGQLVVVSSIAANRGLPKSAAYGGSKAAITVFWEGIRTDLLGTGIDCTTIHPGFVSTEMTNKNKFPMPFRITPEVAATLMANAIEARRRTFTFPWQMRWLERLMIRLPSGVFDRLVGALAR